MHLVTRAAATRAIGLFYSIVYGPRLAPGFNVAGMS